MPLPGQAPDSVTLQNQPQVKKSGINRALDFASRAGWYFFKGGVLDTAMAVLKNPVQSLLMMGVMGALVSVAGVPGAVILGGLGTLWGGFQVVRGLTESLSRGAVGDDEGAAKAFETVGSGVVTAVTSYLAAGQAKANSFVKQNYSRADRFLASFQEGFRPRKTVSEPSYWNPDELMESEKYINVWNSMLDGRTWKVALGRLQKGWKKIAERPARPTPPPTTSPVGLGTRLDRVAGDVRATVHTNICEPSGNALRSTVRRVGEGTVDAVSPVVDTVVGGTHRAAVTTWDWITLPFRRIRDGLSATFRGRNDHRVLYSDGLDYTAPPTLREVVCPPSPASPPPATTNFARRTGNWLVDNPWSVSLGVATLAQNGQGGGGPDQAPSEAPPVENPGLNPMTNPAANPMANPTNGFTPQPRQNGGNGF